MILPDEALAHAELEYPRESGGFLVMTPKGVKYVPLTNAAPSPTRQFQILPQQRLAAASAGQIVGFVHSHPDDTADPSPADLQAHKESGLWDFIVSVRAGVAVDAVRIAPERSPRTPLLGRVFSHGVQDCYSLVRDYYGEYEGIQLRDYPREDDWWNSGKNYYRELLPGEGFYEIDQSRVRPGDLILMQIRSPVENHAAVWLGEGVIIHHLYDQISSTDEYRAAFIRRTTSFWRHVQKGDPSWTSWRQVW